MYFFRSFAAIFPLLNCVLSHDIIHRQDDSPSQDPAALVSQALTALGGSQSISEVLSVSYIGRTILRGRTLMLAASLYGLDIAGITAGSQNITFSYQNSHVSQRTDKFAMLGREFVGLKLGLEANLPSHFYIWTSRPPANGLLYCCTRCGGEGFAAVVRGSYNIYDPSGGPTGYTDGLLAEYLISDAQKWDPLLISTILSNGNFTSRREEVLSGMIFQGVHDEQFGLTVLFDPQTDLPYTIRSYEDHPFFGPSTHDLKVSDYITVDGVQLPTRFKIMYNNKHLLGDYRADEVLVNTQLASDLFSAPGNGTIPQASIPIRDPEYSFAEIGELSAVHLWGGAYSGSLDVLEATQPLADVPSLWELNIAGGMGMRQAVVELADGSVIVLDAPPHQSKIIIKWAKKRLGKPVTHVWPTHHHHDHASGVSDFVANGAKLIVPKQAVHYYSGLNLTIDQILTYEFGKPLVLSDSQTQLALVDMQATIHAHDHGYAYIRPAYPTSNSSSAVFDADHGNLNFIEDFDHNAVEELLAALASDGVAANAKFLASHGTAGTLQDLVNITAYSYPNYSPLDFGGSQSGCC